MAKNNLVKELLSTNLFIVKYSNEQLTVKVVRGPREMARQETIWARFDRLQRSLRPIRKNQRITKGIHYVK